MLYTQIKNEQALYPACILEHFVAQGSIESIDATQEELLAANIVPVTLFEGQAPVDGHSYGISIIKQSDGSWAQELVKQDISEEQYQNNVARQIQAVKADRDRMLAGCDWIVTKSTEDGTPVPDAWKTYRQALRDIPTQEGFPFNIVWPVRP